MTKTEYNQIYNKNNYKQLNLKIPSELYDEFSNYKKEYGSFPKVLEVSLNALSNFKNLKNDNENLQIELKKIEAENNNLAIENNNLQKNILELKTYLNTNSNTNLNNKNENNISDNKLVLEVIDENEKLKNEIVQLKSYNTELKNNLNEKMNYNPSENKTESNKIFMFLVIIIAILLFINFINIFKF